MSGVVVVNQVGAELFDGYGQSVAKQDGYAVSSINSGYLVMGKDSQDLARFIKVGSDGSLAVSFSSSLVQSDLIKVNGTTVATGNGNSGPGVQRVAIATDNTAFSVNAAQSGTWTVQPGNTANTTPWLVNDSSNGTVTPGTAASKSSLIGAIYNSTLPTLTTGQQAALQADSSGRLLIGALPTGSNTIGAITGTGTSGSPTGGVLTIQGVSGATPVPVTGTLSSSATELSTFFGVAPSVSPGNNKSMFSIVNTTGSTVVIKIQEIYLVNVQTTNVSGIPISFEMRRIVSHSSGTSITTESADLSDTLNASVTLRTGATVSTESTTLLWRNIWSADDWQVGSADIESADHTSQSLIPIYSKKNQASKSITLRANQGLTLKCATNTTIGLFDIMVVFTQE